MENDHFNNKNLTFKTIKVRKWFEIPQKITFIELSVLHIRQFFIVSASSFQLTIKNLVLIQSDHVQNEHFTHVTMS